MLSQLRGYYPQTESLLMDRDTLFNHRALWGREPKQHNADLAHLRPAEAALYRELLDNVHGTAVRLEQERVRYRCLIDALERR